MSKLIPIMSKLTPGASKLIFVRNELQPAQQGINSFCSPFISISKQANSFGDPSKAIAPDQSFTALQTNALHSLLPGKSFNMLSN
jgi:hypothetical protein